MKIVEAPNNNKHLYCVGAKLSTITCLHNKAAVVTKTLIKSTYLFRCTIMTDYGISNMWQVHRYYVDYASGWLCDIINLLTLFLQAYQHEFARVSPICKQFKDEC